MSRITARRRDFLRHDPFRIPDTRWLEAVAEFDGLDAGSPQARLRRREPETRRAIAYLRANGQTTFLDDPPWRVSRHYPDVWAAHGLYARGGLQRVEFDARILAGQDLAEIATSFGLEQKAVRTYLNLHFQVLDRLQAKAWIFAMVITPAAKRYGPEHRDIPGFWLRCSQGGVLTLEFAMEVTRHREATHSPKALARGRLLRLLLALPALPLGEDIRLRTMIQEHRDADGSISEELFLRLREDVDYGPLLAQFSFCGATG